MKLLKHIEKEIPQKDSLCFESRAHKLNWDNISFAMYSAEQCTEMWGKIQKKAVKIQIIEGGF